MRGYSRLAIFFLAASSLLYGLHWVHLLADFPNYTPYLDWAKYTDEGWYGKAAMQSVLHGFWRVPGDFNTAVALPVWPALLWAVFKLTGVSVIAARTLALVVFGGDLLLVYALLRASGARQAWAAGGVLLLAANSYLWAFSRLAILEPLLTLWTLASWLLAHGGPAGVGPAAGAGCAYQNDGSVSSPRDRGGAGLGRGLAPQTHACGLYRSVRGRRGALACLLSRGSAAVLGGLPLLFHRELLGASHRPAR